MEKKALDWANIGFLYRSIDKRYVADYKDGAWGEGYLNDNPNVTVNECAGVLQYSQSVFEGLKAYETKDGRIVCFRPDLNAERMYNSALRLEIPPFPKDRFVDADGLVHKKNVVFAEEIANPSTVGVVLGGIGVVIT